MSIHLQKHREYCQVLNFIERGKLSYTKHAVERMKDRNLSECTIQDALKYGVYEPTRTEYVAEKRRWKFFFRDTVDDVDVRICVRTCGTSAVVITIFNLLDRSVTELPKMRSYKQAESETSFDYLLRKKIKEHKKEV